MLIRPLRNIGNIILFKDTPWRATWWLLWLLQDIAGQSFAIISLRFYIEKKGNVLRYEKEKQIKCTMENKQTNKPKKKWKKKNKRKHVTFKTIGTWDDSSHSLLVVRKMSLRWIKDMLRNHVGLMIVGLMLMRIQDVLLRFLIWWYNELWRLRSDGHHMRWLIIIGTHFCGQFAIQTESIQQQIREWSQTLKHTHTHSPHL